MNDPEYNTLSDKDRTILKFSILLHDFGKKFINPETPDTGHEIDSAEIASGIMAQFKLPATVKERILNIIKITIGLQDITEMNGMQIKLQLCSVLLMTIRLLK